MAKAYLVSTLVTGVLLVLIVSYVTRANALHHRLSIRTPRISNSVPETSVPVPAIVGSVIGIILLAAGISVGVAGGISGVTLVIGLLIGILGLYIVWGTYHIARSRDMSYAQAVGIGVWFLGLLLLLGVVAELLSG